jgi:hypothetical protein
MGARFTVSQAGTCSGVRVYFPPTGGGSTTARLWDVSTEQRNAAVTINAGSFRDVSWSTAYAVVPGVTYTVSSGIEGAPLYDKNRFASCVGACWTNTAHVTLTGFWLEHNTLTAYPTVGYSQTANITPIIQFADPVPCQYGTRIKPGQPVAQILNAAMINAALGLIGGEFLGILLNTFIGTAVQVDVLCGSLPVEPDAIAVQMLINPGRGAIEILRRVMWPTWCECSPGASTPV